MNRATLALAALLAALTPAMSVTASAQTVARPDTTDTITDEQRRQLDRIATLGYLVGGGPAPDCTGVTVSEPDAFGGYTIYVSRDYPGAFLVDMQGSVLHSWHDPRIPVNQSKQWTRAWVEPDGSILGITRYPPQLRKLDSDSNILWKYGSLERKVHHDVRVGPDGTIYTLTNRASKLPWFREGPALEEFVCALRDEGDSVVEIDCMSIAEAFRASEYADVLTAPWFGEDPDLFHTNSIEVLRGLTPHAAFRPGNLLLSLRSIDCLAVLDPDSRRIVWMDRGRWQRQHEARETPDGHIQLFDNRMFEGESRVVEFDPVTGEITWSYSAEGFFSRGAGAQQLLPNGNVLVTETQKGRVFEVTPDGRTVWEYWNPRRLDRGKTIVRIARAFRVPYDYFVGEFGEYIATQRAAN